MEKISGKKTPEETETELTERDFESLQSKDLVHGFIKTSSY